MQHNPFQSLIETSADDSIPDFVDWYDLTVLGFDVDDYIREQNYVDYMFGTLKNTDK